MKTKIEREYEHRREDFKLKLKELLEDYNVHIYVDDIDNYYIDTSVLGLYCKNEFDTDFIQPIKRG